MVLYFIEPQICIGLAPVFHIAGQNITFIEVPKVRNTQRQGGVSFIEIGDIPLNVSAFFLQLFQLII